MGTAARSRARVEELLSDLESSYGSFPINQTTLTLAGDRFERAQERYADGSVDTFVAIHNDEGEVLQIRENGDFELPGSVGYPGESLERDVKQTVSARVGIDFSIDGIDEVTIAGISNTDRPDDPVMYRLLVVFSATHEGGEPGEGAAWRSTVKAPTSASA